MLVIKSKEHFLFAIEKQKIDFFTANNFSKSDSWDYFLPYDILGCDRNKQGSEIAIWDSQSNITLFNFLNPLDKLRNVP
jgi:hypothetical protein